MPFPLAVFDLDGTIADTNRDLIPALNHATALEGLPPVELHEVGHVVGQGAKQMIRKAFQLRGAQVEEGRLDELHGEFLRHYEAHIADRTVIFPHLLDQLDALADSGWHFAVCTNKLEHLSRKLLKQLDVIDRFVAIGGADTFDVRKPEPGHITGTIELAGGSVSQAVMIGDSVSDSRAALAVPMPVVLVDFGYSEDDVRTLGADAVLSSYENLADTLRALVPVVGDTGIEPVTPSV